MTSAFKTLFTDMIKAGGDANKLNKQNLKQQLRLYVKEASPHFLVSDSQFFVPAYFTPEAAVNFNSKFASVSVDSLAGKVILVTKWDLELRRVDSNQVWTSYAGLEVRLIVKEFKPVMNDQGALPRHPTNLYRDDEFKTTIQEFRFRQAAAAATNSGMAPLNGNKGSVSQGVVACAGDAWAFKESKTKTVSLRKAGAASPKKATPGPVKATGAGKKAAAKASGKATGSKAAAIAKFAAGPKAKKSVSKTTPGKKSGGKNSKATTSMTTMN
jgi:hypothetical protein